MSSTMEQNAVVRNLQVMTESTQRLSKELKSKYPDVEWKALNGFRNVLTHDYLGLNLKRVWEIISNDLPNFKGKISDIFKQFS
jgi:uncharacterized protein with HEPN domain